MALSLNTTRARQGGIFIQAINNLKLKLLKEIYIDLQKQEDTVKGYICGKPSGTKNIMKSITNKIRLLIDNIIKSNHEYYTHKIIKRISN